MTNEFKTFYEVFLKPNLTILEKQRKSVISKLKTISIIYGIFMIVAVLALWFLSGTLDVCIKLWFIVMAIIFTMILFSWETWYLYKKLRSDYGQNFKNIVIRPIVRFVDDNLNYEPDRTILLKDFYASRFFNGKKIDRWQGEDYVEGTLGKTSIAFSEVNAQKKISEEDGVKYITIFQGLFFKFNFNLNLKGVTMVYVHKPYIMGLGKLWPFKDDDKIQLEQLDDPELNRNLAIYSNNPATVSQFFNKNFLHHLLTFYRRIKLPIYLSLVDGKLYLAISSKKTLFEAQLFKPVNFELVNESFEYLRLGIEIVEMVKGTKAQFSQPPVPNFSTTDQLDSYKINSVNSIDSDVNLTPSEQFKRFYETHLISKLTQFEKQREVFKKRKTNKIWLTFLVLALILSPFLLPLLILYIFKLLSLPIDVEFGYLLNFFYYLWNFVYFVSMIFMCVLWIVRGTIIPIEKLRKLFRRMEVLSYKTNFKTDIIGNIAKFVDNRLTFGPVKQIPREEFQTSMLWEKSRNKIQWAGEDYIQGTLDHNVEMRLVEIHKLKPKKSDKTSKGLFFIFDFKNIDFEGTTLILPRKKLIWPRKKSKRIPKKGINLNLVQLDDLEFAQKFVVYSDKSTFFFPHFQQSVLAFYRRVNKPMSFSLVNGKLYMLITTEKDLFEPPIDETVLSLELYKEFFEYLYFGKQIGEELSLDIL